MRKKFAHLAKRKRLLNQVPYRTVLDWRPMPVLPMCIP